LDLWVIEMNIFSGSRRVAAVAGALWVIGWLIAAAAHETKVYARYDFIVGSDFANFAGFNLYSCPQKTDQRSLNFKTESGHPIEITLCIIGSSINVPQGFILDDPTILLKDPSYISAPLEIKQKLFDTHVASSSNYLSANLATKNAIREKFGVSGVQELEKAPFNPDAYLAKKEGPGTKYQTSTGNPFDIFDESKILAAFKTRKEDQVRLDEKWWESWRSAYGQGLAAMFGGLIALWIFSQAMGWIIRGFLGIPFGTDSKS